MNDVNVLYSGHQQNFGDIGPVQNGVQLGTVGQALRLEGLKIWLETVLKLGVGYGGHVENIGWQQGVKDGELCGTTGQSLRLEAVKIWLTGDDAEKKSIQYQVHVAKIGWMNWVKDGEETGSEGFCDAIEAIRIVVTDKGVDLNTDTIEKFVKYVAPAPQAQAVPAAPAGNLSGKIICINPGHGGSDPGACGDLRESDMNLTVAIRLGQLLVERGATVIYTRTTDDHVYLSDRPVIANNAGADIFVSIHHNGSGDPDASGTCAICYPDSDEGIRLATSCLNGLYNRLGLRQIGLIQRDDSDVTYSDMPAVITEASFASSPADCALFNNGGAELEALGILDGILAYFG